jgi:predicted RNase H-like HicB family nuclease
MKTRYELIIYWSKDDDSFIVEVPELPGCMANGQTYAKAVANAELVIDEWIETARKLGRPIPEPRGKLAYASDPLFSQPPACRAVVERRQVTP